MNPTINRGQKKNQEYQRELKQSTMQTIRFNQNNQETFDTQTEQ